MDLFPVHPRRFSLDPTHCARYFSIEWKFGQFFTWTEQRSRWWWAYKQKQNGNRQTKWWLTAAWELFMCTPHGTWSQPAGRPPWESFQWPSRRGDVPKKPKGMCKTIKNHRCHPTSVQKKDARPLSHLLGRTAMHCAIDWLDWPSRITHGQLSRKGKFQFKFWFGRSLQSRCLRLSAAHFLMAQWYCKGLQRNVSALRSTVADRVGR